MLVELEIDHGGACCGEKNSNSFFILVSKERRLLQTTYLLLILSFQLFPTIFCLRPLFYPLFIRFCHAAAGPCKYKYYSSNDFLKFGGFLFGKNIARYRPGRRIRGIAPSQFLKQ